MKTKQEIMLEVAKDDVKQTLDSADALAIRATRWLIINAVVWVFFVASAMVWVEDWDINWLHKVQVILAHIAIVPIAFAITDLLNVLKGYGYNGLPSCSEVKSKLEMYDSVELLNGKLIEHSVNAAEVNKAYIFGLLEKIKSARTSTKWAVRIFLCAWVVGVFA